MSFETSCFKVIQNEIQAASLFTNFGGVDIKICDEIDDTKSTGFVTLVYSLRVGNQIAAVVKITFMRDAITNKPRVHNSDIDYSTIDGASFTMPKMNEIDSEINVLITQTATGLTKAYAAFY